MFGRWKVQPTKQVILEDCRVPVENRYSYILHVVVITLIMYFVSHLVDMFIKLSLIYCHIMSCCVMVHVIHLFYPILSNSISYYAIIYHANLSSASFSIISTISTMYIIPPCPLCPPCAPGWAGRGKASEWPCLGWTEGGTYGYIHVYISIHIHTYPYVHIYINMCV